MDYLSSDPDIKSESLENVQVGEGEKKISAAAVSPKIVETDWFPLLISSGSHRSTAKTRALFNLVGKEMIAKMTTRFYQLAFADPHLDRFIRSHNDPHGERFANWISEKLGHDTSWSKERARRPRHEVELADGRTTVVHDRSSAHAAAWYSVKREPEKVGRHFKVDDARVWMRLHFLALREVGIVEKSPEFAEYYCRFIGHFVRVYESRAPMFAREAFRWGSDEENVKAYVANGRVMTEIIDKNFNEHVAMLPQEEAEDVLWPYYDTYKDLMEARGAEAGW